MNAKDFQNTNEMISALLSGKLPPRPSMRKRKPWAQRVDGLLEKGREAAPHIIGTTRRIKVSKDTYISGTVIKATPHVISSPVKATLLFDLVVESTNGTLHSLNNVEITHY